jgi:broad specificity phosphatase PhoE
LDAPEQAIWLTRHGNRADFVDPDWRLRAARPHDPPLSPDGVEQARQLGWRLVGEGVEHLFASPFLRTVETAAHVADALDLPIRIEDGICEMLNPDWFPVEPDLLPLERLAEVFPRVDATYRSRVLPRYPESWDELVARSNRTVRLLADEFHGDLLVITHGGSLIGVGQGLLNDPHRQIDWPLCGLTKLVRSGKGWRLAFTGETSHLSRPAGGGRLY